jgi:preprotein translocase SecE subunit
LAKTRAQRKAERRAREAEQQAQQDTQTGKSGDVAEVEAVEAGMGAGAPEDQLETPDAPKQSRAQKRAQQREQKEKERKRKEDAKRRESEQLAKRQKQAAAERQRGGVLGFFASCWAELKKVQWPDRDTLVQATAVTIIFVAVAAAYLGALDGIFNLVMDQIL